MFDDVLWRDDLAHASEAGQLAATTMREELARDGARIDLLRPCEAEARDGTCLPGCMKLYVPAPAGRWGIVFQLAHDDHGVFLAVLAFGIRHPTSQHAVSVYAVADARLHHAGA